MTSHRVHHQAVIECDNCGDTIEDANFADCWNQAKALNWTARKDPDKGFWEHFCPDCKNPKPNMSKILRGLP